MSFCIFNQHLQRADGTQNAATSPMLQRHTQPMSTPINHHYVSQSHSRYFFNEAEKSIYCYDKQLDNYYSKPSIKSLFSEDLSNTRFENNKIDNQTLEDQLNEYFEKDFPRHANNIIELANDPLTNDESKQESLYYIACYALIADVRFPFHKKGIDESYSSLMKETAYKVRLLGDESQASAIEKSLENDKTKYSNVVNYTTIAASRLQKMGDLDFNLFTIKSTDKFILPDIGCILIRERINNYFNPHLKEVAMFGIPLTDKVFLFGCSKKLEDTSSGITTINDNNSEIVANINVQLFESALKTVATSDERQLKQIVEVSKSRL